METNTVIKVIANTGILSFSLNLILFLIFLFKRSAVVQSKDMFLTSQLVLADLIFGFQITYFLVSYYDVPLDENICNFELSFRLFGAFYANQCSTFIAVDRYLTIVSNNSISIEQWFKVVLGLSLLNFIFCISIPIMEFAQVSPDTGLCDFKSDNSFIYNLITSYFPYFMILAQLLTYCSYFFIKSHVRNVLNNCPSNSSQAQLLRSESSPIVSVEQRKREFLVVTKAAVITSTHFVLYTPFQALSLLKGWGDLTKMIIFPSIVLVSVAPIADALLLLFIDKNVHKLLGRLFR